MTEAKRGRGRPPKAPRNIAPESEAGFGDMGIFRTLVDEAEQYGERPRIPERKQIVNQGVVQNVYLRDLYLKDNPSFKYEVFWWAHPLSEADEHAWQEKAQLDNKHYEEVVAHPTEGPWVAAGPWRKDAGYRVFNGRKQLFVRDYKFKLMEEAEVRGDHAMQQYEAELDNLKNMADRMKIEVTEQDGDETHLLNSRKSPDRIYSR